MRNTKPFQHRIGLGIILALVLLFALVIKK